MPIALPSGLQAKLDALANRYRRQRLTRGVVRAGVVTLSGAALVMAADAAWGLPVAARIALTLAWLAASIWSVQRWLVRPARKRIDPAVLAAAVESEFPRLDERLTTSVELAHNQRDQSPALLGLLLQETENRTSTIDFQRAARAAPSRRTIAALLALGAVAATAIALWPEHVAGVGRRFLMPWDQAPALARFAISVEPGDLIAARGRPLLIEAETIALRGGAEPQSVTFVRMPANGPVERRRLAVTDRPGRYSLKLDDVKDDFRYFAEAEDIRSREFSVRLVAPIEIQATSTNVVPPDYARAEQPPVQRESLGTLEMLQHGRLRWTLRFDRQPAQAFVFWRDIQSQAETKLPLVMTDEGKSGAAEMIVSAPGTYQVVAEAEHSIATTSPRFSVNAVADRPPEFRRVTAFGETLRQIGVNDVLPLQLVVGDDFAVTAAEWELQVNDGPILRQPLPLSGLGTREASGAIPLRLAGQVQVGDRVASRLRITDNRSIPEAGLKPQSATFPPNEQWCEWIVTAESSSVSEREATAQRDAAEETIRDLVERMNREIAAMNKSESRDDAGAEHQRIRDSMKQIRDDVTKLGDQLDRTGLRPLGDEARAVASRDLQATDEHLRDAQAGEADSAAAMGRAEKSTTQARDRLERLRSANAAAAKQRIDAAQVEKLATQQEKLADQTQAHDKSESTEKLKETQRDLAEKLDKLAKQSDAAKSALQAASAEQAKVLADKAKALADAQRELDRAIRDSEKTQNAAKLAGTADDQRKLADDIEKLAKALSEQTKGAPLPPIPSESARESSEALRRGEMDEAAPQQKQTADGLDRLAEQLQAAIDAAKDPREAAKQLSRLQADTRKRTLDSSRPNAPERPGLINEQKALQRAIERLPVPQNTPATREQIDASIKAKQAITALENGHHNTSADLMKQAKEALDRLAEALPSTADRQKAARELLLAIRKEQAELAGQVKSGASRPPKGDDLSTLAKRQAELAERIGKLDTPQFEDERDAARRAAGAALDDLTSGRWSDVVASQDELDRELTKLDAALSKRATVAQKAKELARRQREISDEADRVGGDAAKLGALTPWQEQVEQELRSLQATASPVGHELAKTAAADAVRALRDRPEDAQSGTSLRNAAERLAELADQLASAESAAARAQRIAKQFDGQRGALKSDDSARQRVLPRYSSEMQQLRAGDQAATEKKATEDALARAQRNPTEESIDNVGDAMRRLAEKLSAPNPAPPDAAELAQKQRALANSTGSVPKQFGPSRTEALDKLANQQRELREQAKQANSERSPQAMQAARQAMAHAEQALARQETSAAQAAQLRAAQALDRVVRDGGTQQQDAAPPPGTPTAEQVEQARNLARQQRELAKRAAEQSSTTKAPPNANGQQGSLANEAGELANSLQEDVSPPAANAAKEAEAAMREAQQRQSGDPAGARAARARAADALDRAAQEAIRRQESEQRGAGSQSAPSQSGQSLMQARTRMKSAQQQLGAGQTDSAAGQMQDAAAALRKAANGLRGESDSTARPDGSPAETGPAGQKPPLPAEVVRELERHPGKKWGELPGELRTRILEDVKAQYGDDYARLIRLYFESLADKK